MTDELADRRLVAALRRGLIRSTQDDLGECDWGDCDNPASYLRKDDDTPYWLPVCDACAHKPKPPRH